MICFNSKGSVTVFLCIAMPVVILLCLVFTEIYMINTGKKMVEDQVELAGYSVLSNYSDYLKGEYDLYAYCSEDHLLENSIRELIRDNLASPAFYRFKVEEITIVKEKSLMEKNTLKQAIMNTMKDSIFETIATEVYDRLHAISSVGETIDIIKSKMKFDEKVKKINENLAVLKQLFDGGQEQLFINILKSDSVLKSYIEEFYAVYDQLTAINERIRELEERQDESIYEIELLLQEKGTLKEKITDIYYLHINDFIQALIQLNHQAFSKITDIILNQEEMYVISNAMTASAKRMKDCPVYLKEMIEGLTSVMVSIEKAVVIESFELLENKVNENIRSLTHLNENMESVYQSVIEENPITDRYRYDDTSYNSELTVSLIDSTIYGQQEDNRSFFEKLGEEIINQQLGEDIIIESGTVLPSGLLEDENQLFDIDVSHDSSEEATGALSSVKEMLSGSLERLKEQAFLNEYIILKCSSQTGSGNKLESSFFQNEIEYILFGNHSQHLNTTFTKSAIMLIRFALNTAHVYSDAEKQIKANAIAATVAGWWTFGAGIPVISNLVSCAWAVAESGLDVKSLSNGGSVPVYKLIGDWKLDLGLNQVSAKTPEILKIDYEDYMRLLLLSKSEDDKLGRLLDLIQLNAPAGFDVTEAYCQVTIHIVVSQRGFLGKRHYFEIEKTAAY
ncbi:MAG: hypothetical protein JXQ23_04580 [Clostridia bacterium]|nr:hypothetical protein [Clostridia bacterium]